MMVGGPSPNGGKFVFDDGGIYIGGWEGCQAHGYGVCTGPKNVGEFSGLWNFGYEVSGVYKWNTGALYEGRWQNGKRHHLGVEYNGKWIYRGEWSQGHKGRYGVKLSSNSAVKYEGTWANGLQDGYGSETYSDGGYYQGQMCRGLRHGYGVRKSAQYGESQLNNPHKNGGLAGGGAPYATAAGNPFAPAGPVTSSVLIHSNSIQSSGGSLEPADGDADDDSPKPGDGFKPYIDRTLASKNGFVLVAKPLVPHHSAQTNRLFPSSTSDNSGPGAGASSGRRSSLTNKLVSSRIIPNQTASLLRRGFRLTKQKSTSDLDNLSAGGALAGSQRPGSASASGAGDSPPVPFALSPEELDITDPMTVETYTGEWKQDKRNGHGVCERSDGLRYEGQWHNDMKCGYGVTTFRDGSKEEGKYKNNILQIDSKVKRLFQLTGSNVRQRVEEAVKMAQQAQTMALKKAEIADTRAASARAKAELAVQAAKAAACDSELAFRHARTCTANEDQQQYGELLAGGPSNFMAAANLMGGPNGRSPAPFAPLLHQPGAVPSSLQMRRFSQQQQLQQEQQQQHQHQHQQQQQQQQQHQHQQQLQNLGFSQLGPDLAGLFQERLASPAGAPLRGAGELGAAQPPMDQFALARQGSFRVGAGAQQPAGYQSPYGARGGPLAHQAGLGARPRGAPGQPGSSRTEPLSDLFDHYRSSGALASGARRLGQAPGLSKQTSLDYGQLRASVPRQMGSSMAHQADPSTAGYESSASGASGRMRRFRMSSMDHAEEHQSQSQGQYQSAGADASLEPAGAEAAQQRFRHLVTSGVELLRAGSEKPAAGGQAPETGQQVGAPGYQSPAGASGGAHSAGGSSAAGAPNQTPSPELAGSQRSPAGARQLYGAPAGAAQLVAGQMLLASVQQQRFQAASMAQPFTPTGYRQAPAQHQLGMMRQSYQPAIQGQAMFAAPAQHPAYYNGGARGQRDAQSLADEQLYLAGRRSQEALGWPTEYANYDFTISDAPRPVHRRIRRTASLSRGAGQAPGALARPESLGAAQRRRLSGAGGSLAAMSAGARNPAGARHGSPLAGSGFALHQAASGGQSPFAGPATAPGSADVLAGATNHLWPPDSGFSPAGAGAHALDQLGVNGSSLLLNRKPSLQVRYNPVEIGGLMSREEVAALSHAQREQKRLEAEQAERRAKQPLLHFYLSLRDFIASQKLVLSVIVINVCLFKMFADLIT